MGFPTMDLFNTIKEDKIELTLIECVDKNRILQMTMERIGTGQKPSKSGRPGRILLVAAVMVTLLLGTVVLASHFLGRYEKPMEMLGMAFGDEEFQSNQGSRVETSYYENVYDVVQPTVYQPPLDENVAQDLVSGVQPINQSVTYPDGTTLTVISHLHDPTTHSGVFYCTLENPKGIIGYYTQSTGELSWYEADRIEALYVPNTACRLYMLPGDTTATRLSLACYYIVPFTEEYSKIWVTQYKDKTVGISLDLKKFTPARQWQSQDGTVTVTPTGIALQVSKIKALGGLGSRDLADMDTLVIRFKDGTEYLVEENTDQSLTVNTKYWLNVPDKETHQYTTYGIFNRLVDVDQIQRIEINGEPIN